VVERSRLFLTSRPLAMSRTEAPASLMGALGVQNGRQGLQSTVKERIKNPPVYQHEDEQVSFWLPVNLRDQEVGKIWRPKVSAAHWQLTVTTAPTKCKRAYRCFIVLSSASRVVMLILGSTRTCTSHRN
jgi:hypothetical protein